MAKAPRRLTPKQERERQADAQIDAYVNLGRLAEAAYTLAGEVMGYDEQTLAAIESAEATPALDEIDHLAREAERLVRAFAQQRADYVTAQLRKLGITNRTRGLKLNIGAGRFPLKGWFNVDLPPAPLGINLRWGLPLPSGSATHVFMSHVLEHFYYPEEALSILKEIRRVLAPGGRARLVVPDIEKWLVAYASGDKNFFAARKKVWPRSSTGTRLEQLLLYVGSGKGAHPSFFFGHKAGYDYETLHKLFRRAGFVDVVRSEFMGSADKALRVDDHSAVADASFERGHYSLFIEGSAPRRK